MTKKPKVSVVTICYNQEKYLEQALDSFVAQKTNFDFEVIIADDCSTDGSRAIIKKYANLHPEIIKPILREKNVGAQNNFKDAIMQATGEYIALCEGDDYWTDDAKLQRQADYLDSHQSYALCFHPVQVRFEAGDGKDSIYPETNDKNNFTLTNLLKSNFIQTNSVVYRRQNYGALPVDILPLDWYLHLYHAQFGKIGFINEVMSVYRRHNGGIWWESANDIGALWKRYGVQHLGLFAAIYRLYGNQKKLSPIINKHITNMINTLYETNKRYKTDVLERALARYPEIIVQYIGERYDYSVKMGEMSATKDRELAAQQAEITSRSNIIIEQSEKLTELDGRVRELDAELQAVYSSKLWKIQKLVTKHLKR